jgi:hypothetical protein
MLVKRMVKLQEMLEFHQNLAKTCHFLSNSVIATYLFYQKKAGGGTVLFPQKRDWIYLIENLYTNFDV